MEITLDKIKEAYKKTIGREGIVQIIVNEIYGVIPKYLYSIESIPAKESINLDNRWTCDVNSGTYKITYGKINFNKTLKALKDNNEFIWFNPERDVNIMFFNDFCIDLLESDFYIVGEFLPKSLIDNIIIDVEDAFVQYISSINNYGAVLTKCPIQQVNNFEILDNYNDDLPNQQLIDFIKSNDSGLCVLRGNPGTGKTYYIRSLINMIRNKIFVTMDLSDFNSLIHNKQALNDIKDKILILEDCEELLKSRDKSDFGSSISTLLNLTDGLFGDCLKIKVICTFNADLRDMDKALFRKGRIKLMYEFKELSQEKADKLRTKLGKSGGTSNILCDIFNEDGIGVTDQSKPKNRIGF